MLSDKHCRSGDKAKGSVYNLSLQCLSVGDVINRGISCEDEERGRLNISRIQRYVVVSASNVTCTYDDVGLKISMLKVTSPTLVQ